MAWLLGQLSTLAEGRGSDPCHVVLPADDMSWVPGHHSTLGKAASG